MANANSVLKVSRNWGIGMAQSVKHEDLVWIPSAPVKSGAYHTSTGKETGRRQESSRGSLANQPSQGQHSRVSERLS